MPIYIAMLRGINVGGHKLVKMEKLRAACQGLGFEGVKTYIQSGNIVFRAAKMSDAALAKKLGDSIVRDFGFSADVITRTAQEMGHVIDNNPLLKQKAVEEAKFHVVFLSERPAPASLARLQELTLPPDRVRDLGREIYFYFPNGVSGSSLWKHPLDKILTITGTMRNWNTVNKLYEMARELE
ncbi:MAG TPA: DUF1697 domain-containing protein [Candidatus Sulfotelmatobacter sp.]|nr:DUF1697 domain-containing protein [Candidatus Sulfotelmatobacter sp.]